MELNWNGRQATTLVIDRTTLATGRSYSLADLFRGISWDFMSLGSLAIMAGGDPWSKRDYREIEQAFVRRNTVRRTRERAACFELDRHGRVRGHSRDYAPGGGQPGCPLCRVWLAGGGEALGWARADQGPDHGRVGGLRRGTGASDGAGERGIASGMGGEDRPTVDMGMSEEREMAEEPSQRLHRQASDVIEAGIKDGMTTQDAVEGSLAKSLFTKALRQATEVIRQGVEQGMVEAEARRARRAKLEEATKEQMILTQERTIVELLGEWTTDREKVAEAMALWMELWQERQERQRTQDAVSE